MRKKHYTLMTLALAGVMAFGGAGLLSLKISDAKTQEGITTKENDITVNEKIEDTVSVTEKTEEKNLQDTGNISLPEGAKIKKETKDILKISWDGRQITYHTAYSEKETEADMGIERAVGAAIKSVQQYTKQDLTGENIEISLQKNIPQDDDNISVTEGTEYKSTSITSVTNKKNYGIRYYAVDIDGKQNHNYSLCINSITGEVFGYADYYDKDATAYNKEYDTEELEQIKPEYIKIAENFVKDALEHLGDAKEFYAFTTGFMETENGTRNTFDISCKTKNNDIVVITMDQLEKTVLCFEVNPLWD